MLHTTVLFLLPVGWNCAKACKEMKTEGVNPLWINLPNFEINLNLHASHCHTCVDHFISISQGLRGFLGGFLCKTGHNVNCTYATKIKSRIDSEIFIQGSPLRFCSRDTCQEHKLRCKASNKYTTLLLNSTQTIVLYVAWNTGQLPACWLNRLMLWPSHLLWALVRLLLLLVRSNACTWCWQSWHSF